jgi:hypothetical protein
MCLNGARCIDKVDGHARETEAPDTFCDACFSRAEERVEKLPQQYVDLHAMIGDRHAGVDVNIKHAKPSSSVLLNLHVDTLLGNIVDAATTAAEVLAEKMDLKAANKVDPWDPSRIVSKEPIPLPPWADASLERDPAEQVQACCRIIAPQLSVLAGITGVGGRDLDDRAIDVGFWNRAGTMHGLKCTTGVQLVQRLDYLSSLSHFTLGMTRARDRRPLPCNRCHAYKVGRWAGAEDYDCQGCGARFEEDDLRRQDRITLELHKRGLIKVGDDE